MWRNESVLTVMCNQRMAAMAAGNIIKQRGEGERMACLRIVSRNLA